MRNTATILMWTFLIFLLALIIMDILMIVSLLKTGDERRQLIVWKASSFTLLAMVGANILNVAEQIIRSKPMVVNTLVQLNVYATIYFASLMYYKRKHGG